MGWTLCGSFESGRGRFVRGVADLIHLPRLDCGACDPLQRIFKRYAAAEPVEGERASSWKEVVESANTMTQAEFLKCLSDFHLLPDYVSRLQAVEIFCVTAATWVRRCVTSCAWVLRGFCSSVSWYFSLSCPPPPSLSPRHACVPSSSPDPMLDLQGFVGTLQRIIQAVFTGKVK